jgi:hypothetical protein
MDTKKLFHAIVIMGMTSATACSSSTPDPGQDAAADTGGGTDSGGGKDSAVADTGSGNDSGGNKDAGDAAVGWLGC